MPINKNKYKAFVRIRACTFIVHVSYHMTRCSQTTSTHCFFCSNHYMTTHPPAASRSTAVLACCCRACITRTTEQHAHLSYDTLFVDYKYTLFLQLKSPNNTPTRRYYSYSSSSGMLSSSLNHKDRTAQHIPLSPQGLTLGTGMYVSTATLFMYPSFCFLLLH